MSSDPVAQRVSQADKNIVHEFNRTETRPPFDRDNARKKLRANAMYVTVMDRIDHHIQMSVQQIAKYGRWALRTRFILPLLSTIATGLASIAAGAQGAGHPMMKYIAWFVAGASFVATVFSALNSAVRPSVQYAHYVRFINRFWHVKVGIGFDLEEILLHATSFSDAENSFQKCLIQRNKEMEDIIVNFSDASITNIGVPRALADGSVGEHPLETSIGGPVPHIA
jgi:hypothetical protein